jgi:hypothetical protein
MAAELIAKRKGPRDTQLINQNLHACHNQLQLNRMESERFVKALIAPPKQPPKRVKTALALHRATVKER